jgi:H+/gluconate symporter-like permease
MVAKLARKAAPRRVTSRRKPPSPPPVPTVSERAARIGKMIALGSLVAAGMLAVVGVGAVLLLATEPSKRSGRRAGWNLNDLSNSARDRLSANLPSGWGRAVREDLIPEARDFVTRQTRRFS